MKLVMLIGTYFIINVVYSIKLVARANEQVESKVTYYINYYIIPFGIK